EARAAVTDLAKRAPRQAAVVTELLKVTGEPVGDAGNDQDGPGELSARDLSRQTGASSSSFRALVDRGILEPVTIRIDRRPVAALDVSASAPPIPTVEQRRALDVI